MRIDASKIKAMSAHKFKALGQMFIANGRETDEIRSRINLTRSTFPAILSLLMACGTFDSAV